MFKSHPFLILILASTVTGCQIKLLQPHKEAAPISSFRSDGNGLHIRRIAVLPPFCNEQTASSVNDLSRTFQAELSKTSLFELVPISHAAMEMHFGHPQISSVDIIPGDLLFRLRSEYGVEGVLFIDITHYFPYSPVSIGIRVKLVDATTGKICWAFDHLFDSSNPTTSADAQAFYLKNSKDPQPLPLDGSPILQSPTRFSRYVAYEVFRSLKNVTESSENAKVLP